LCIKLYHNMKTFDFTIYQPICKFSVTHVSQALSIKTSPYLRVYFTCFLHEITCLIVAGSSGGDSSLRRSKQMTSSMVNLSGNSNSNFVNSLRRQTDFGRLWNRQKTLAVTPTFGRFYKKGNNPLRKAVSICFEGIQNLVGNKIDKTHG